MLIIDAAICPPLEDIPNGVVTYTVPSSLTYEVGTVAIYQCMEDYTLLGATSQRCVGSLTWSGQPPTCIKCELVKQPLSVM